ncbi:cyclodeaminase/cyclohydrolase family protein, partial [uncultured Acidaminococcus sp.]
ARAAVRGAFLNVKINLGSIKDQTFVDDLKGKMAAIEKEVDGKEQALLGKVNL